MDPKNSKFRIPRLSTFGTLALLGFTGWDLMESWHRHSPGRFGYGIIFALAVGAAFLFLFSDRKK